MRIFLFIISRIMNFILYQNLFEENLSMSIAIHTYKSLEMGNTAIYADYYLGKLNIKYYLPINHKESAIF